MVIIPPELLAAVCPENGPRLALVIGAGCSVEPPTDLPLGAALSHEAHRRLILEGTLEEGECKDPADLAALATLVFGKTGSQVAVVRQFPLDRMKTARPNEGYRHLIALMIEGVVSHVLSLNFDLAAQNAAADLGEPVTVVDRPGVPVPMARTVVHLHGSVNSPAEDMVLRVEVISEAWKEQWQDVVAKQVLAAPNVLFVGLGSAAPVLSETVRMIANILGNARTFFQAGCGDHAQNNFAKQLNVGADRYINGTWCEVMSRLSKRLVEEQVHCLRETGRGILKDNGMSPEDIEQFDKIATSLADVSLLALGRFRAHLRLNSKSKYVPRSEDDEGWLAAPLKALASIAADNGLAAVPKEPGLWHLERGPTTVAHVLVATGRGQRRLSALEIPIRNLSRAIEETTGSQPEIVLVSGTVPGIHPQESALPPDILEGIPQNDIIVGQRDPLIFDVDSSDLHEKFKDWLDAA